MKSLVDALTNELMSVKSILEAYVASHTPVDIGPVEPMVTYGEWEERRIRKLNNRSIDS